MLMNDLDPEVAEHPEELGTQGILQGTYETFAECGNLHFDGSLEGRLVVTAGLGQQSRGGSHRARCRADFVVLDPDSPALVGRTDDDILDSWIFAARQPPIREVWVGGRRVVAQGRHLRREEVFRRFEATVDRLLQ